MNVLFVPAWYPDAANPMAGTFVREHALAAAQFHSVTILHLSHTPAEHPAKHNLSEMQDGPLHTIQGTFRRTRVRGGNLVRWMLFHLQVMRGLRRRGWTPDIVHAHVASAGLPALAIARVFGVPLVMTEHSSDFPLKRLGRLQIVQFRQIMQRAARVLPVSESLREALEDAGIRASYTVIPNAVETTVFTPPVSPPPPLPLRLLSVARHSPVKGLETLLAAASRLRQNGSYFQLRLVGDGPERDRLEAMTLRLGLERNVTFLGTQSKPRIAEELRYSHALVLSSYWENLPCVVLEALACGCPVVASDVGGVSEAVTEETGILVPPGDPDRLAEALSSLSGRSFDSSRIRAIAEDKYSHLAVGRSLDTVYREARLAR